MYKSIEPAWNDSNLREITGQVRTPMLLAHVRASTGTPVQRSNCHPFRHGQWLWMHNGALRGFHEIRRELVMAVAPALFPDIEGGSTDSETLFFLALTFGLVDDPFDAVARAVGFVEEVGRTHGVEDPVQMTVATTDGASLWIFRYSSERQSRSLFFSTGIAKLRALHPEVEVLHHLARRPVSWSPSHSATSKVRGTKCRNPRPGWSGPATTKSGRSNRSHRHEFAQRRDDHLIARYPLSRPADIDNGASELRGRCPPAGFFVL